VSDNLPEVQRALDNIAARIEAGMGYVVNAISNDLRTNIVANASEGKHKAGTPRIPTTGPNRVTGNLVNNIIPVPAIRTGFGSYVGGVNSGAVYSRVLEEGSPLWSKGVKFPYVAPAVDKVILSGRARSRVIQGITSAIRG